MKALILAGGGGTRLWPVSRRKTPKQVEPIIGDRTLLRATYDRVRKGFSARDIYVATAASQRELVERQLPGLPKGNLLLEPHRRDTAAAIGFGLLRIAAKDPQATFVTINSDAYVRDEREYHRILRAADRAVQHDPDRTVLVGITPTYPETGYGYIKMGKNPLHLPLHKGERVGVGPLEKGEGSAFSIESGAGAALPLSEGEVEGVFPVERFVEKPDRKTAEAYLAQGRYLWNPTLIVGRVDKFLALYDAHLPAHARAFAKMRAAFGLAGERLVIERQFRALPAVSIDYGILEKEKGLRVIPADFGWADVGNWRTVKDILARGAENVVRGMHVGVDSNGNLIYSFSGKLVATAGVTNMIIIETADAILVCPQDRAHDVKKIVSELEGRKRLRKYL